MKLNVLCIEDDTDDAEILRRVLRKKGIDWDFNVVKNLREAAEFKSVGRLDCVLLDLNLGDSFGIDTLRRAKEIFPDTPIVVVSGSFSETSAHYLSHEGSMDEVHKSQITMADTLLARTILKAMERHAKMQNDLKLIEKAKESFERVDKPLFPPGDDPQEPGKPWAAS